MITCKGLRWSAHVVGSGRRRLLDSRMTSGRQFSSASYQGLQSKAGVLHNTSFVASIRRPHSKLQSLSFFSISSIRYASTTPAVSPPVAETTTFATPVDSFTSTSLNNASEFTSSGIADIPESIGYLKDLGLDYGWGPTAFIEWLLEHIHIYTGTPWWASIILTAVAVRVALLKPYIDAADVAARMATIKPITKPITDKMSACSAQGDRAGAMAARSELQEVHRKAGVRVSKAFIPLVQIFLGFGTFRCMRGMATLPVPGLETGGFLWIRDLTLADPYFVLPAATSAAFYIVMRKGGETGTTLLTPQVQKIMTYGLPLFSGLFMLWWPGALQLTFFATSMLSMGQATLLRNPAFRAYMGITPLPPPTPVPSSGGSSSTPPTPYAGRLNIAPTYQAPTVRSSIAGSGSGMPEPPTRPKGFIGGAVAEMKGTFEEASKSAQKYLNMQASEPGKRSAVEIKQAKLYEEKRQREIEQQQLDELEDRKQRRSSRSPRRQSRRRN
ncbi:MAG: Mitochondrial inner membrane protein oxa1 [Pycnora praestabilis]|nr:MAG: Mitochondrial inner membrane protein oxa1 [Pycnora praestabilis]